MEQQQPTRNYLKIGEAAEYLHVTERTIRQMIDDGRLRAYHNGTRLIRVDRADIDGTMRPIGDRVMTIAAAEYRQLSMDSSRIQVLGQLINQWRDEGRDDVCDAVENALGMTP